MRFHKYHGLGNDYIVPDSLEFGDKLEPGQIRRICHRHCGIGSDGILFGLFAHANGSFAVRIFNPDGSEAGKSGNGLRIFARYPCARGRSQRTPLRSPPLADKLWPRSVTTA